MSPRLVWAKHSQAASELFAHDWCRRHVEWPDRQIVYVTRTNGNDGLIEVFEVEFRPEPVFHAALSHRYRPSEATV